MAANVICNYFGHKWMVKYLNNAIKANGERYKFSKIRKCARCEKHEYFYSEWIPGESVSPDDLEQGFINVKTRKKYAQ